MDGAEVPRTGEDMALLEASYVPIQPAVEWSNVRCEADRWWRHAEALREVVQRAEPQAWDRAQAGFLRAAALDSSALAKLIRPAPELTTVVLRRSVSDGSWCSLVDATGVVVECHRRALVVAADAAAAGRPMDEDFIARLQDLIVESQRTYTVTVDGGERLEVELPRRQYKSVSNFLMRTDQGLVPFAPVSRVAEEMGRLSSELASDAFAGLHPVVQSAYIHLALIRIHPFADGNGRLARTLACMPLLREVGLPQLILADQWPAYMRALEDSDDGDPRPVVQLFLAAQVNSMDLARSLVAADRGVGGEVVAPARTTSAERTLLDLVAVHLREAIGAPGSGHRVAVSRGVSDPHAVRAVTTESDGDPQIDIEFTVEPDEVPGWLRVSSSAGDVLEVWRDDVHPVPVEVAHLRVRTWLDGLLLRGRSGLPDSAPVRGLFVLGSPRSGTTMMGNWLGSHPDVLRLGEYGGFYIAHAVAPSHLSRLPGGQHEPFLVGLRALAGEHASRAARRRGRAWFCDATPWNLQVAGAVAIALPDAVFVLMLRHFSGAVLSLRRFPWAGNAWADAARLWADINACIDQLPQDRTVVVSYDVLAAHPAETVSGLREALWSIGLDPERFDDRQFLASHAHIIGEPRPTIASTVDGHIVLHPIPSLDGERWTPEVHAAVWPVVADTHRMLLTRFGDVYEAPSRPGHVPDDEW
jgi:hypothetical protein